ncbi:transposase [Aurantimonas aggregata]|uniref:Transposase n=1 Tax=Aurantimonas aggregata TaxID=2047720 RepID=A0A6L9MN25_9HYPH|nr:transposase [Aurantimonas aggregata]NDV89354.1 transposase [Aurantimonas aggregata]
MTKTIELISGGGGRRRRWTRAEKERLVSASLEPDVSTSEIARSAGISVSQLFRWRKQLCKRAESASATSLLPVLIEEQPMAQPVAKSSMQRRRSRPARVEIELPEGRIVRTDADIDTAALARILEVVDRLSRSSGSSKTRTGE